MIVMPTTYSPMTVARAFNVVEEFALSGRVLHVIYDRQTPRAAIIEADVEMFEGVPRHRVIAALDLQYKSALGRDIVAVERCWEDTHVLQAEGVCVDPAERDKGLATRLYEALILKCGITLISDFEQYDGTKVIYDGGCIPEERIWSISPDQKCHGVVLVAEDKQRANQLMETTAPYRV